MGFLGPEPLGSLVILPHLQESEILESLRLPEKPVWLLPCPTRFPAQCLGCSCLTSTVLPRGPQWMGVGLRDPRSCWRS